MDFSPKLIGDDSWKVVGYWIAEWHQRTVNHLLGLPLTHHATVADQSADLGVFPSRVGVGSVSPRKRPTLRISEPRYGYASQPTSHMLKDLSHGLRLRFVQLPALPVLSWIRPSRPMPMRNNRQASVPLFCKGCSHTLRLCSAFLMGTGEQQHGQHEVHGVVDVFSVPLLAIQ